MEIGYGYFNYVNNVQVCVINIKNIQIEKLILKPIDIYFNGF